jgi:hypothetical protein
MQKAACLKSDHLTRWKIPGVIWITSKLFCIHCCNWWMALTSVA